MSANLKSFEPAKHLKIELDDARDDHASAVAGLIS
jgi:hypothetical protein